MFEWLKFGAVTWMILKYRINDEKGYRNDSGLLQTINILLGMAITGLSFAVAYEFFYPGILIHTEALVVSAWTCTFAFIGLAGVQVLRFVRRLPVEMVKE